MRCKEKYLIQIKKDLNRTPVPIIENVKFAKKYKRKIQNILFGYSNINPSVGYVQGMNFIVSALIKNIIQNDYNLLSYIEEDIFWLFSALMENFKINEFFNEDMKAVFNFIETLNQKLIISEPDLMKQITSLGEFYDFDAFACFGILLYTLNLGVIPMQHSSRILDLIFLCNYNILTHIYTLVIKLNKEKILEHKDNINHFIRYKLLPNIFSTSESINSFFSELNKNLPIEDIFTHLENNN